jgi:hypothetical protein
MTKPIAALLSFAGLLASTEAQAQHVIRHGGADPVAAYASAPTNGYTAATTPSFPSTVYPYSYYAALPGPARGYVAYGANDFPFHGVPYGHPYDPWTWPYMSGSYSRGMARYYDPPVK